MNFEHLILTIEEASIRQSVPDQMMLPIQRPVAVESEKRISHLLPDYIINYGDVLQTN